MQRWALPLGTPVGQEMLPGHTQPSRLYKDSLKSRPALSRPLLTRAPSSVLSTPSTLALPSPVALRPPSPPPPPPLPTTSPPSPGPPAPRGDAATPGLTPATSGRKPATPGRKPATTRRKPATTGRRPATAGRRPKPSGPLPATPPDVLDDVEETPYSGLRAATPEPPHSFPFATLAEAMEASSSAAPPTTTHLTGAPSPVHSSPWASPPVPLPMPSGGSEEILLRAPPRSRLRLLPEDTPLRELSPEPAQVRSDPAPLKATQLPRGSAPVPAVRRPVAHPFLAPPSVPPAARPNTRAAFSMFGPGDTPAAPSPFNPTAWARHLRTYPDKAFVLNILGMIKHGAKLGYDGPLRTSGRAASSVRNASMAPAEQEFVRAQITERVSLGRAAVYDPMVHPGRVVCSPIGVVPKAGGKLRMINNLSYPRRSGPSVNAGIPDEAVSLHYENLDNVMRTLSTRFGDEWVVWKVDWKDAFHHVVVALQDAALLGYFFEGKTYVDCTLNFGGRSSPFIFNYFAEGVHWILEAQGLPVSHYLDDFFGVCRAEHGQRVLDHVTSVIESLGGRVSPSKCQAGHQLELLGITFDTRAGTAWLSPEKLARLNASVNSLAAGSPASIEDVRSLAGLLVFVSRVCPPGRAFIRGIFDWLRLADSGRVPGSSPLRGPALDDVLFWKRVLVYWQGTSVIRRRPKSSEIWTDAATSAGIGGHLGPRELPLAAFSRPSDSPDGDIMTLEALALRAALVEWGKSLRGQLVRCKVDNQVLAAAIRTGRCRHAPTQAVIREIFVISLRWDLELVPDWIPSEENYVADALSRFDIPSLQSRCPSVLRLVHITHARVPPVRMPPPPVPDPPSDEIPWLEPYDWGPRVVGGDSVKATYLWYGLSASTRGSYDSVVKSYVAFARLQGWTAPFFPVGDDRAGTWIAHEARRAALFGQGLYKKTLTRKVAALISWHTDLGLASTSLSSVHVDRVIRGAMRYHGVRTKDQALPITLPILRRLIQAIRDHPRAFGGYNNAVQLIAMFTLGFGCFMRMGELTWSVFDPDTCLTRSSVKWNSLSDEDPPTIHLSASKTDPFRFGVTTVIPRGPNDICPARALHHHMALTHPRDPSQPLFELASGGCRKSRVVAYLTTALRLAGYPTKGFSGHSLRRGAATWAASIGLPPLDIKTLGRWNSDSYKLYVDTGTASHVRAGGRLLSATAADSSLPEDGIPRPGQVWRPSA